MKQRYTLEEFVVRTLHDHGFQDGELGTSHGRKGTPHFCRGFETSVAGGRVFVAWHDCPVGGRDLVLPETVEATLQGMHEALRGAGFVAEVRMDALEHPVICVVSHPEVAR